MHNFGPASQNEVIIFGAQRPGYPSGYVPPSEVDEWAAFMKSHGIQRVCCLLAGTQLGYYPSGLLKTYRKAFGKQHACHAPVEDYHLAPLETLTGTIFPFLVESARMNYKVVVHCSGGSGRTGHVLAAWLVYARNLPAEEAFQMVRDVPGVDRDPYESLGMNASLVDFKRLFDSISQLPPPGL
jgi:protein-tyrosine phosphatase